MAKKRIEKPQRQFTKHQLARWQKEKKRQRIIFGVGIFIIVTVLSIVGVGWFIGQYQPLHQTVIRVNDVEFDTNYYIKILKYYGEGQSVDYLYGVADDVVKVIERNELIRQGAMKLGISVSDSEVDEEIKGREPPLSKDYRDLIRTGLLVNKLQDEYFNEQVPVSAEQRHVMLMFLESASQAIEVRENLEGGSSFAEVASELSLDGLSKAKEGDLDWHTESIFSLMLDNPIPLEYAFGSEIGVLSQPIYDDAKTKSVGYWLIKVLERNVGSEEANVQAMLLGSEEEAQQVRSQLEAAEDFAALASELSQEERSKENGGDLGWVTKGTISPNFDEFVFNTELELGILSEPIRDDIAITKGGYWLIKVVERDEDRQISDDDRNVLKATALDEWVAGLWDDPENMVTDYLDNDMKLQAIDRAAKQLGLD